MSVSFPSLAGRSIGVGMDLPWGQPTGFATDAAGVDAPTDSVRAFFESHTQGMSHAFVSWQPRSRGRLSLEEHAPAWDALMAAFPANMTRALHHTALNLAHSNRYDRTELFAFTNALIKRYGFAWVNEDLGFWSLNGKPLPYPLPPLLTDDGLAVCVDNVNECQEALDVPLLVEFPGFSKDWSLVLGQWDAYDFFREVVVRTNSPCTLDTGHLLSWRWWQRARGQALFGGLDRLPLENCFEIHLSGAMINGDDFVDAHHGVLLDEQLDLLDRLLDLCPNVKAVTFEDPKLQANGAMAELSRKSFNRVQQHTAGWLA